MGAHIDVAALLSAAGRFDAAADALDRTAHTRTRFGAAAAGRAHVACGEAVRAGVDQLSDDVRSWARADSEIASVLRTSADRYVGSESRVAGRLT